jgi:hypothetical protein
MSVTLTVVLRGGTTMALRFVGDDCEESAFTAARRLRSGDGWLFHEEADSAVVMINLAAVDALSIYAVEGAA